MLNKIIGFSLKNKLIIGLFVIGLVGYGIYETTQLPIDAVPDITNNQVQVITVAPSFGATDIERLITFPIEQVNSNIDGLLEIRSFSRFGLSLVTIVFEDDVDIYWARQQVAERLQNVKSQIPQGIGIPELGPISTGLGEIYQYVVRAKEGYESKYDAMELRTIQDWIVRRQLLGVKGVAEVSSFGGKLKQYEISVNPDRLQSYNLTIDEVFTALEQNNQNTGGAYIEKGPTVLFIRSEGLIGSKEDIENVAIKETESGTPIFIRDVAEVNIGNATRYGALCYNDKGETSGAVVMMLKGANSSQVIENVKNKIAEIQKTLPEGVLIEPFLDRTKMVNNAIGTVEKNLVEGALIVVFILVLFLGNFRAGLLVASVIPLAMLFAIILMNTFGVSGNLMSLGALDFGLIVDGAVIIVEAVMHQLAHGKRFANINRISQQQMDEEVGTSAGKMMNSAVFGQVIILIVYLPILSLSGIEGKMFKPMAQTVAFALIGAFILSLTYIPMMSSLMLSKKIKHTPNFSDRLMKKLETAYQRTLTRILRIKKMILTVVAILFAGSIIVLSNLGGEFIPALEEGDFAVETRVLTGSNLKTTIEYTQKAAHVLLTRYPEVEKVVTKIGSGEVPSDPMPMEASDLMIILKDKSEWTSAETFPELAEKMGESLKDVPGITTGFQYPVQMRFNELMTGARQDVVCKIFGEDLDSLASYAEKLGKIIGSVKGAQDLYIEPVTGMPQIVIKYNRAIIAQYNVNVADINRVVNTAFAGQAAGSVYEGEKRFDLVVRMENKQRSNLEDIQNLLIPTPKGIQIPLNQLAEVGIEDGPNQIQREETKRRIVVGFNVRGRDVQSIVEELQNKVDKQLKFSPGYYVTFGGAFENLNEAKQRLSIAVPVSLALIFLLLFFAFSSVKQGLLIYTAIPLSAIGGIYFLALRGMPFSISAGVGFIALFGVAVLNGIVLIAEFNRLKESGMKDLHRIVIMGTKIRLRPVLMTAFVASLGFLPMALSHGAGAEVQRPLATVVIGGLLLATFLTLFVLPILYVLFENIKPKKKHLSSGIPILILLLFAEPISSFAQKKITLNEAYAIAEKNNLSVKNKELLQEYQKSLMNTAFDPGNTSLTTEMGQINSSYFDTKISLVQSFSFPMVYKRQKQLLNASWDLAAQSVNVSKLETKRFVAEVFYYILILKEKEKMLLQADSIFTEFVRKANIRFEKGESNILEKTSAESQKGDVQMQLMSLKADLSIAELQFQLLLNTTEKLEPLSDDYHVVPKLNLNSLNSHPNIIYMQKQVDLANGNVKFEKAKLLPDITAGYFNQSIQGVGADNLSYTSRNRFNGGQIGLGIPIFSSAQKARIKAAGNNVAIAENELDYSTKQLQNELDKTKATIAFLQERVLYYESVQLPNSELIQKTAMKQFTEGEIDYMEWTLLNNQAIQIRNSYLDALQSLNEATIYQLFLTNSF
jgi:cobalt-zinc-cadmium resistance protein CzcA